MADDMMRSEHYRRLAEHYDDNLNYNLQLVRRFVERIQGVLGLDCADLVADIGCGTGLYTKELAELVGLVHPVLCIDSSPEMLEQLPRSPNLQGLVATAEQ